MRWSCSIETSFKKKKSPTKQNINRWKIGLDFLICRIEEKKAS